MRRTPFFYSVIALSCLVSLPLAACRDTESVPAPAPVVLTRGAVAADFPASRAIGEAVLRDGGSAADAAVATALALGVENPASSGLGGGGFAVVWDAGRERAHALDFRERAPKGADAAHYLDAKGTFVPDRSLYGCYAAGVPGELAGFSALHERFGRLSWERVVSPAQRLAANGWKVSPFLAYAIRENRDRIAASPELARVLLKPDGSPWAAGDEIHDEDLANTLSQIARGHLDDFYGDAGKPGNIAAGIEAACREVEGAVRASDLAEYSVIWRAPLVGGWRGKELVSMPPPSSGGAVMLEVLNILAPFEDFDRRGANAAGSHHVLTEAMKHGFADRATSFGDPGFVKVPVEELVSEAYADRLRKTIEPGRTHPTWAYGRPNAHGTQIPDDAGTAHVSVVDADGNAIALTTSVNGWFGSFVRAPQTGILLNNTMDDFSIDDAPNLFGLVGSRMNRPAPGKRPVSSMTPVIVMEKGRVRLVAGGSGGPRITTATLQTVIGVVAENRNVQDAVDAPRLHHQWNPDVLRAEPGIAANVVDQLRARGHDVQPVPMVAVVQAVEVKDDRAIAATDARKNSVAIEMLSNARPLPAPRPTKPTR